MLQRHQRVWRSIRVTADLLAVWAALAGFAAWKTHKARVGAERFLADFMELRVGVTPSYLVDDMADRYGGRSQLAGPFVIPGCGPGSITYDFAFDNRWSQLFLFAPLTRFSAMVYVSGKDGRVCDRAVSMANYNASGLREVLFYGEVFLSRLFDWGLKPHIPGIIYTADDQREDSPRTARPRPFFLSLKMWKAVVIMNSRATDTERSAAFSVNLRCLTKLRGCRDTEGMNPTIWRAFPGAWPAASKGLPDGM